MFVNPEGETGIEAGTAGSVKNIDGLTLNPLWRSR